MIPALLKMMLSLPVKVVVEEEQVSRREDDGWTHVQAHD